MRNLRPSDCSAVAGLLTSALPHHPVSDRRCRRHLLEAPGFDPELALGLDDAQGGVLAMVAALRLPDAEGRRRALLAAMATREECRKQGLMRSLYAELEGRLRDRGIQDVLVGGGPIPSGLDLRYQPAVVALLRRLYVTVEVGYDMTPPSLECIPEPPRLADDFELRELGHDDGAALKTLCEAQFPFWASLAGGVESGPSCGVVGVFERSTGRLAAFARYDEYIFGPTGTSDAFRRLGLGTAVFWAAIQRMRAMAPETPVVIGNANIGFYARAFGCPIRGVIWRMKKDLTKDMAISKGKALI